MHIDISSKDEQYYWKVHKVQLILLSSWENMISNNIAEKR